MTDFVPCVFENSLPRSNKQWRSNILQEAEDTCDTFDTLKFRTVDEYLAALKTIEPIVHGLVIAGRRAHATPGAGMTWGRALSVLNDMYSLQMRCAPKGLFAELQRVANELTQSSASHFSEHGRGLHSDLSELVRELQPCVLMHSLTHNATSSSTTSTDKVVSTTILIPQPI
jgi:hypothetical protein